MIPSFQSLTSTHFYPTMASALDVTGVRVWGNDQYTFARGTQISTTGTFLPFFAISNHPDSRIFFALTPSEAPGDEIPVGGLFREIDPAHARHLIAVSIIFTSEQGVGATAVHRDIARALQMKAAAHRQIYETRASNPQASQQFMLSAVVLGNNGASGSAIWADALVWWAHGTLAADSYHMTARETLDGIRTVYTTRLGDEAGAAEATRVINKERLMGHRVWLPDPA